MIDVAKFRELLGAAAEGKSDQELILIQEDMRAFARCIVKVHSGRQRAASDAGACVAEARTS